MRKFVVTFLCVTLAFAQLAAQNRVVTGKVTDEKGAPIVNASVIATGTKNGTTTTTDGTFKLTVANTVKALKISSLNFVEKTFTIGANNIVNAVLSSTSEDLDDVVVVGYGAAKKRTDVSGSVVQVSATKLQNKPSANMFDALQGKVPGLQIYTSSGEPSATPSIRLNGVGSLGASSTPLYVMDGMPIDAGSIVSLNPEDFESITVLKDASSTSIYGSRASNGVIFITSKKGKLNSSQINLQVQTAFSSLTNNTKDLYNSFMNTKQLTDFWIATGYQTKAQVDSRLAVYNADTKWYKQYYKDNVPTKQIDLNISGGGGKTTYYVSGSAFKQEGLAWRSNFERYTLRSNVNTTVNNWFKLGLNLSAGYDERQTNAYSNAASTNGGLALLTQPFYSAYDAYGVKYPNLIPGGGFYSPEYLAQMIQGLSSNVQFNPSGFLQVTPFKGMTLKTQAGLEFYDYVTSSKRLPSYLGSLNNGSASESFSRGITKTITNTAEYTFRVKDRNTFTALAGQEFIGNVATAFDGGSTGQTDDRLIMVSSGPTGFTAGSSKSEYAYTSYFGRLNYNLDTKYYLDLSVRNDLSSRFGKELRGATFYSVGAMWKAKKENLFKNLNWLNDLTFKGSIGTSGNSAIGNYDALATVGTNLYGGATGWGVSAAGNPQLSWEEQRQINFGVQASFFNRLNIDVEVFDRKTKNMLVSVPYPYTSGFSSIRSNVGSLKNSGINANVNYDFIKKKNSFLNAYVNIGYVQQKVTELFQGKNFWIIPGTGVSWAIGQPVSYFYPVFAQINPANGNPEWYKPNINPDLIVKSNQNPYDVTSTFNSTALQQSTGINRYAPLNGGFGFTGGVKQFSLSADFSFSQGKYMINNDRYFFENPNQFAGRNQSTTVLDYWKQPGDIARFPKYGIQFTQFDSRLIEDASFIRLKALTLAYNVAKKMLDKTKFITGAKVYVTGRNIWTLTKYTGPDPEVDSNLSLGANPNTSQIAFGLNLTF